MATDDTEMSDDARSAGIGDELPLTIKSHYAELLDLAREDRILGRPVQNYVAKTVKGRTYWYAQIKVGGETLQRYLGPDTDERRREIEDLRARQVARLGEFERRRNVVRALRTALPIDLPVITARILNLLADAGAFEAGAIVIGTYAYAIYAAMLGRRLPAIYARTGDLDLAAIDMAVAEPVALSDVIAEAEARMFVVPPAPHARISTRLKIRGGEYRVELLTPARADGETKPVVIEGLKFGAQPLPYLDFLIAETVEAVVPADVGILVTVPMPERFALHKLIVATVRDRGETAKRDKDLAQADALLAVLEVEEPDALAAAWQDLCARGEAYEKAARRSLTRLEREPPAP